MAVILAMVPYSGTGSTKSMRAFTTSVIIYKKAQKNFGESTHTTRKTRLMHIMIPS